MMATSMQASTDKDGAVKLIAFYLTQFHPIPENDLWWGKGFTEWTNVTKAEAQFVGHYQPHLPTDLGFYDLRLRETRHEQIELAKSYGIDGFCYYYYWFSGKRLLERPLDDMLADPASDMPFCLCWANENWTRKWDAAEHEILIAQEYRSDDDAEFIKGLIPYFQDSRYIRVNGAPLLIVYRPQHLPDSKKSVQTWRRFCAEAGIPQIHVACALTHGNWDHVAYGFDSGVEFPPHNMNLESTPDLKNRLSFYTPHYEGFCPEYKDIAEMYLTRRYSAENSGFRAVFPSWDNTARRGAIGTVILNGTPENYEHWLASAIQKTKEDFPGKERLVFINAWNEWAEGCHLEPDRKFGHLFLEATLKAKTGKRFSEWTHIGVPAECRITNKSEGVRAYKMKRKNLISRTWRRIKKKIRNKQRVSDRDGSQKIQQKYLSLMEATLVGAIYEDPPLPVFGTDVYDTALRETGLDWPSRAFTMVGSKRLHNVRHLMETAIESKVSGDFVETGVWRGGASIMARAVLAAYGVTDRLVVACDSFEGLPLPDAGSFPADADSDFHTYADLAVSLEAVKANFEKFDLMDDQVFFVKGWFRDSMKNVPSKQIAVLRLDGDMYESTIYPLNHLYDRISSGGWVIVDDYHVVPAAKEAVHDFLNARNLTVEIREIDGVGVYFRKED